MSEESVERRDVVRRARRRRWNVDVIDVQWSDVCCDGDGEDLEICVVVECGSVELDEFDIMVDEDDEATPTTIRPIATKKSVVAEGRIFGGWAKLRFLQTSNLDIVLDKIAFEFTFRRINPVDV